MSWKRQLFLVHRWLGIVLCSIFVLWFVSGFFMMYVEFPQLTKPERLAGEQRLDFSTATLGPSAAIGRLIPEDFATKGTPSGMEAVAIDPSADVMPRAVRLAMILERPAYVIHMSNGSQPRVVFADDGAVLRSVTPEIARAAVGAFVDRSGWDVRPEAVAYEGTLITDQWTVSAGLNGHRPLLRFALHDADATVLYVSSRTAEVVRDTHRLERVFNYFGAVTHWIYPTFIRKYPPVWEWIVDVVSSVGVVLAISGLWIGWLRWNRRARPNKPQVPYRGIMRWHYFTGAIFGVVTLTWVFSGLLSMNPLDLDPPSTPDPEQALIYAGRHLTPVDFELPANGFGAVAVEADLVHFDSQPFYRVTDRDTRTRLVAGNSGEALRLPRVDALIERAPRLMPNAALLDTQVLTHYDDYYYARKPERGERALPVIRVRFDDAQHTWFHLDPTTGQIIERSTRTNRLFRWLYNGLHSFDIWWLWQRRPLWDIVVILFLLGGTMLSVIGVVIGWRRLRHKSRRRARGRQAEHHGKSNAAVCTVSRSVRK